MTPVDTERPTAAATRSQPPPGTWVIDTAHSSIEFVSKHLMVAKVRGRFAEFSGKIEVTDDAREARAEASIVAASIDTRQQQRDEHLKSPDFLDVERFPTIEYRSTAVRDAADGRWELTGDLTIRGITVPVSLDVEFQGLAVDPWGNERAIFSARGEIDREQFGMTWNQALETGGVLVGKKAVIEIEAEAVRQ